MNCTANAIFPQGARYLAWTVAFGRRGARLAKYWLAALQGAGKWSHDIVILGDARVSALSSARVRGVDITNDIKSRYGLDPRDWTHWTINNLKSQIGHYAELARYQYIIYLDADVIVTNDQIAGLVADKCKTGVIAVQEDCVPLDARKMPALENLGTPTAAELSHWAKTPICAGIIGIPINEVGRSFLADYIRASIAMRFELSDQAKLTALLHRKYPKHWEYIGSSVHGRRCTPPYRETFVHFTGQRDILLKAYYHLQFERNALILRVGIVLYTKLLMWWFDQRASRRAATYWRGNGGYLNPLRFN